MSRYKDCTFTDVARKGLNAFLLEMAERSETVDDAARFAIALEKFEDKGDCQPVMSGVACEAVCVGINYSPLEMLPRLSFIILKICKQQVVEWRLFDFSNSVGVTTKDLRKALEQLTDSAYI